MSAIFGALFGGGKSAAQPPAAPPPPPSAPMLSRPSIAEQGAAERESLASAEGQGFTGTDVTGGQGASSPNTTNNQGTKSLLGG